MTPNPTGQRDEAPIVAALEAIIAYDGVTRTETLEIPQVIQL